MLRLADYRGSACQLAARVDQLDRIQQRATVIALIAACIFVMTHRAPALNQAIRQKAPRLLIIENLLLVQIQRLTLQELQKEVLCDLVMVLSIGMREQIVADPQ